MSCSQTALGAGRRQGRRDWYSAGDEIRLRREAFAQIARTLALWLARRRQRRDLARLDDHLLKDIGVTREQAAREAAKPFWIE